MNKPLILLSLFLLSTLEAVPLRLPRQSDYDQCSHPFHSFLCHKAPRSRVLQPEGSAIDSVALPPFRPEPTKLPTTPPTPSTTSRKLETLSPPLSGENTFLDPTFITKSPTPYFYPKPSIPFTAEGSIDSPVVNRVVPQPAIKNEVKIPPVTSEKPCGNGHSFHSFLCNPGTGRRRINTGRRVVEYSLLDAVSITKETTTTERNVEVPDASFQSPAVYKPPLPIQKELPPSVPKTTYKARPTLLITSTTTTTTPSPDPEAPDATFDSPSFLKPAQQQRIEITQQPEHYKGQDACKHAFHSYLCQPSKSRRRNYGRIPEATFQQPQIITTTRPLEVPEASQLDAVALQPKQKIIPLNQPPPPTQKSSYLPPSTNAPEYLPPSTRAPSTFRTRKTTTAPPPTTPKVTLPPASRAPVYIPPSTKAPEYLPPTTTTQAPIQPAPSSDIFSGILPPRPESTNTRVQLLETKNDKCKHAFHSFLCQPATRTRKIIPAASVLEGSLLLPEYRTTTKKITPTTTTRVFYQPTSTQPPPPPLEEINQVPDSTFQDPQRLAPPRPAANSFQPVSTNTENLCDHPFHSFLCNKTPRARRPIKIN